MKLSLRGALALAFSLFASVAIGADASSPVFKQGTFNAPNGTPPFIITSQTKVNNLYVDRAAIADNVAWSNTRLAIASNYSATITDCAKTLALGGGTPFTLTLMAASNYSAICAFMIVNEDATRGKKIAINGYSSFILWPKQTVLVFNDANVWQLTPRKNRWSLTADTTFYFDQTNGNNANDCLAAGAGNACQTPQGAWDILRNYIDLNGFNPTLQAAAGQTYTTTPNPADLLLLTPLMSTGNGSGAGGVVVTIDGANSTFVSPSNGQTFASVSQVLNVPVRLKNMKISQAAASSGGACVTVNVAGYLQIDSGIVFQNCVDDMFAATGGTIQLLAGFEVIANTNVTSRTIFEQQLNGNIQAPGFPITVTLTGGPNWGVASTIASSMALAWLDAITFSGVSTGQRYNCAQNSTISTGSGGAAGYLPGNSAGAAATGCIYD